MSIVNSYLRVAMMFGNNPAHTFITNLEKMIELILSDEAPKALLADEIVDFLRSHYSLNFTDIEVTKAIDSSRGKEHICCINEQVKKKGERKFVLRQKALEAIKNKEIKVSVLGISELFLNNCEEICISVVEMESLLNRYFYRCFNSNATTIMQLLKQEYTDGVLLSDGDLDEDFPNKKKR